MTENVLRTISRTRATVDKRHLFQRREQNDPLRVPGPNSNAKTCVFIVIMWRDDHTAVYMTTSYMNMEYTLNRGGRTEFLTTLFPELNAATLHSREVKAEMAWSLSKLRNSYNTTFQIKLISGFLFYLLKYIQLQYLITTCKRGLTSEDGIYLSYFNKNWLMGVKLCITT